MRRVSIIALALLPLPLLWIEVTRALLISEPIRSSDLLMRCLFIALTLGLTWLGGPIRAPGGGWLWPWTAALMALGLLGSGLAYALSHATWAAYLLLVTLYPGVVWVVHVLAVTLPRMIRPLLILAGTGLLGLTIVSLVQVTGRFSEEELFVAVEALVLGGLGWWLGLAWWGLQRAWPRPTLAHYHLAAPPLVGSVGLIMLSSTLVTLLVSRAYQRSFFPTEAPGFIGISAASPLHCGTLPPESQPYHGNAVFSQLLALVAAHPQKGAPEYGMLALGTGQADWAAAFRSQLLAEAAAGRFSHPANSVKYIQYEAAGRVYYYDRVRSAFPDLFSENEQAQLAAWFAAINRRALTIEWVDWAYSLALGSWPTGPYANQETGAGLLALLQATGLADPNLAARNQAYLDHNPGGWALRFRNTDDAIIYQPEWMNNALFQQRAGAPAPASQIQHSADWLYAQALPDGMPLQYNYPLAQASDGAAYLAATLLDDPRYLWLAGRALEGRMATLGFTAAQPGVDAPLIGTGTAPSFGSCLIFGDSGMPNQVGPLAPDKIVLRDGWARDSSYALLNLRFTGWHRYKATNTLALVYRGGPLVAEQLEGAIPAWMPQGRRFFRDKRIPRENLSGLLVGRRGLDAASSQLSGIGSPWAQDPPFYAEIVSFTTTVDYAHSVTLLRDWHGWQQQRSLWLYHAGPLVVYDQATGPANLPAAISWNLPQATLLDQGRLQLAGGVVPAELVLLGGGATSITPMPGPALQVIVAPPTPGQIALISVFLSGPWLGADVTLDASGSNLLIKATGQVLSVPLHPGRGSK
jgi:hypothetical protein